jgi:hypothetical protein
MLPQEDSSQWTSHSATSIQQPHQSDKLATLDLWCDADLAGLWGKEDRQDPSCVQSPSGILLMYGNTSVFWSSKLQSKTAPSTMEADYIALSAGMHLPLHLHRIHKDIYSRFTD